MAKANKMKLDIELLNRIMSDIFPKSYFSKVIEVLDLNLKIGEVCRRYSEEVNKKPDTKTAEEIMNELNKKRAIKWDGLSDEGKWSRAIEAMHEIRLPSKEKDRGVGGQNRNRNRND